MFSEEVTPDSSVFLERLYQGVEACFLQEKPNREKLPAEADAHSSRENEVFFLCSDVRQADGLR